MDNEKIIKSLSQVHLRPDRPDIAHREKSGSVNKKNGSGFQLNSLGGPLEGDFTVQ
ncbi:MAG: hypothetical protein ACOY30_06745 [Bacillota bacterium]